MATRQINSSFHQQRNTIMFFLPVYSKDEHLENGEVFKREVKVMYLNPQSFAINEQKLIKPTMTKGGYAVQYWGEELTKITANGTTGSAGIEGINILRDIYRHEQIKFRDMLDRRRADEELRNKVKAAGGGTLSDSVTGLGIIDAALGGLGSRVVSGASSIMDAFREPFEEESFETFSLPPSLATFATSIDMYYQGEIFRGFFTSFSYNETATEPGIFTYQFAFTVTRRSGERLNFMPWHKNPLNADGTTKKASEPNSGFLGADGIVDGLISNANLERTELSFKGMGVQNLSSAEDSSAKGIAVGEDKKEERKKGQQPLKRR